MSRKGLFAVAASPAQADRIGHLLSLFVRKLSNPCQLRFATKPSRKSAAETGGQTAAFPASVGPDVVAHDDGMPAATRGLHEGFWAGSHVETYLPDCLAVEAV